MTTVGVLALQGAVDAHLAVLAELGVVGRRVRRPVDLDGLDALVMPGGESTTMGAMLVRNALRTPLAALLDAGLPVLGTCAGMILLADEILDGRPDQHPLAAIDLSVRRNAFGRQLASFEADLDVAGMDGGAFHAVFIRAPWVERVGDDVEVLARVEGHPVCCRQGSVLVTSFHPELTGDARVHELALSALAPPS